MMRGGGMLRMADNPRVKEALGLSADQVGKLHALALNSEKASVQNRAQMETAQIELRELMRGENPDQSAIDRKIDELSALRGKMQKQHVDTMLAAKAVLTPEQRAKIKTFMENRGAGGPGGGHMMEHRGGPGGHMGGGAGAGTKPPAPPAQ
jgi:Spy/CpxP family protein refolding chaperone